MQYSTITYTIEQRTAIVTLNRPDQKNALDDVMIRELTEVFTTLNRNTQARTVVLTGSGNSFCAGMDLGYLQKFSLLSQEENIEDARNLLALLQLIHHLKKPVIAMVNGSALGGGCGIAAACDFVFVSKSAKIGVPEVRLGFVPAVILLFVMKRMGEGAAREFVLRGDILDASTAKERRLITEVVEDDELRPAVFEFAETLARTTSPSSLSLTKDLFQRFDEMDERSAVDYAVQLNALARKTDDFKKGIEAFLKKEKLQW